jgi:fungal STAND N-terminal Goodbye domain
MRGWSSASGVCIVDPSPRYTTPSIRTLNLSYPFHRAISSQQNNVKNLLVFMSAAAQATSPTSNIQLIIDALADYANVTGIDLSDNPFAATLEQSNSPEAILQLLQGQEKAFKEYREGDRRLISCLTPAVKVLQAFSGILGDAASLVGRTCIHLGLLSSNVTPVRSPSHLRM